MSDALRKKYDGRIHRFGSLEVVWYGLKTSSEVSSNGFRLRVVDSTLSIECASHSRTKTLDDL